MITVAYIFHGMLPELTRPSFFLSSNVCRLCKTVLQSGA